MRRDNLDGGIVSHRSEDLPDGLVMSRLLTKRKAKWVAQRRPDVIRGDALTPSAPAEVRYYARLNALIDKMTADVEKELKAFFDTDHAKEYFAMDASVASQARILTNKLMAQFNTLFAEHAKPIAENVAAMADASSSAQLHSSIQKLSGGLSLSTTSLKGPLTDVLNATITENVGLIKSISQRYLADVQGAVMRSITTGNGLQDLVPFLEKHKGITKRKARGIAKDQTRKAFNNLNKGRMQQLGLKKFEWLHTSGSTEPRQLHIELSGHIFSFDDLPVIDDNTGERGIPGQAINCRCKMIPVIDFEE